MNTITITVVVNAPLAHVWNVWATPQHIEGWAYASDGWAARDAENDLRVGGRFKTHMYAKDGSAGFDFEGVYTIVEEHARIAYVMDDGRTVTVIFEDTPEGVRIMETFDPENENPIEMQRAGWQQILMNFKTYAERTV